MCKRLAEKCTSEMDIAALSPYEAQCLEIGKHLKDFPKVALSSVDSAQGNCFIFCYILKGCVNMFTYLVSSISYTCHGLAHTCVWYVFACIHPYLLIMQSLVGPEVSIQKLVLYV